MSEHDHHGEQQRANVRAIGLTLSALRAIARTEVAQLADRAAEGFRQLPASTTTPVRSLSERSA
ncbi:MAG TPA: hypothetical protein VFN67_36390 [Polyangiales bacterium]|nr:hypothetical protein [Polyangiales bacterium]